MTDKPFASLSSSLLARKGNAKPAMRPQGFADLSNGFTGNLEDLGWNDMGPDDDYPHHHSGSLGLTPAPRPGDHLHELSDEGEYEEFEAYEEVEEREEVLGAEAAEPVEAVEDAGADEDECPQPLLAQKKYAQTSGDAATTEPESSEEQEPVEPESIAAESADEEWADGEWADSEPVDPEPVAYAAAAPSAPIAPPPVVEQQRALRDSFAEAEVVVELPRRRASMRNAKPKAAFTLRLDPERHLKLRLASAITRRSAQQLVTGALDDFFNTLPELEALAQRVPAEAGQRRS
jgi:hypothetical protein